MTENNEKSHLKLNGEGRPVMVSVCKKRVGGEREEAFQAGKQPGLRV